MWISYDIAMENGPFLGIYDDLPMKNGAFP